MISGPANKTLKVIQRFGMATLLRSEGGGHKLLGGTGEDVAAANDWASLVAHEIVFSHPGQGPLKGNANNRPTPGRVTLRFHSSRLD